jgi:hypothetical protein
LEHIIRKIVEEVYTPLNHRSAGVEEEIFSNLSYEEVENANHVLFIDRWRAVWANVGSRIYTELSPPWGETEDGTSLE